MVVKTIASTSYCSNTVAYFTKQLRGIVLRAVLSCQCIQQNSIKPNFAYI